MGTTEFTKPGRVGGGVPFARNGRATPVQKFLTGADPTGRSWLAQAIGGESRYGGTESITRPYEESAWAHVAIKAIAAAVRQCPLVFYREDPKSNPDAEPIPGEHPLAKLFRRPNQIMDPARFTEAGAIHRKLDGEDFWFLFDKSKHPVAVEPDADGLPRFDYPAMIMPVRGRGVELKTDRFGFPAVWKYPTGGQPIEFPWGAVVQFADYDPDNPLRGLGDIQALLRDLALEFGGQRYLEAMLTHSGDPGGIITTEDAMSEEEEDRASKEVEEKFKLHNAFKWHVISGEGLKYVANKFGPKDMQFQELLKWVRDKTGSVLGVPLPVMGILDDATFSNYGEAVRQFWQHGNGVLAYMTTVENTINYSFLPRLKDEQARRFVCRFDTSKVEALQDDKVSKVELALKLCQAKIGLSWEESAAIAGLSLTDAVTQYGGESFMDPNTTTAEAIIKYADEKAKNDARGSAPPPSPDGAEDPPFPGSDDFESGSNGPTGSDGKTSASRHNEVRGAAATAGLRLLQREALPDDEAAQARRDYYKGVEDDVIRPGEAKVRRAAKNFLRKYQDAQIKLIEDFAREGPVGLAKAAISPADIIADEALMGNLLLAYAEWVEKMAAEMGVPLAEVLEATADDFGSEIGAAAIPADDPWASNFLRSQNIRLSEGVNSTLAEEVRKALVAAFEKRPFELATLQQHVRAALPELRDSLRRAFSGRSARAATIARTEVNRAANATRVEQMRREGVEEHQWVTSGDAFVRSKEPHSHVALDGVVRRLGDSFRDERPLRHPGDPAGDPEDVINCFAPGTLVAGDMLAGSEAVYHGPAVEIVTCRGHHLTVTPNHPVLSDQGWVRAGDVEEGAYLVSQDAEVWRLARLDPDEQNRPTAIEDAFDAIGVRGARAPKLTNALDFHGDARFTAGHVNVVALDRELLLDLPAPRPHLVGDLGLPGSDSRHTFRHGGGLLDPLRQGTFSPARSRPCSGALPLDAGTVTLEAPPLHKLRFGAAACLDSAPPKVASDGGVADAVFLAELLSAGSGLVSLDEVVAVRRIELRSHVYDLQSDKGWILANGIVNSNCRCVTRPLVKD